MRHPGGRRKKPRSKVGGKREKIYSLASDTFIVKVQAAIASNEKNPPCLVYNRSRSIQLHLPFDKFLAGCLKGRPKVYLLARLNGDKLEMGQEVGTQDW